MQTFIGHMFCIYLHFGALLQELIDISIYLITHKFQIKFFHNTSYTHFKLFSCLQIFFINANCDCDRAQKKNTIQTNQLYFKIVKIEEKLISRLFHYLVSSATHRHHYYFHTDIRSKHIV